jgi:hypothetical protein
MGFKTHGTTELKKLFKQMEKHGFIIERSRNGVFFITPPPHIKAPLYKTHGTAKAIKPIRADFRKMYGIEL